MHPSLSVRIAEHPRDKSTTSTGLGDLAALAAAAGFEGMSLRASIVSVESTAEQVRGARATLDRAGLAVSMVTGDLPLAVNDAAATRALHDIAPYLDLAEGLGTDLVRVMVHRAGDLPAARRAADAAAERGIRLAQQCHWGSLAETVDDALDLVAAVDRDNFGITYEPANLLACGGGHGPAAIRRLAPHLFNVYFQNVRLDPGSPLQFASRRRGPVGVRYVPLGDAGGIDAYALVQALDAVGYRGWFTVHQPLLPGQEVAGAVAEAGRFVAALGPVT